jgi:hypothetical protein
MSMHYFTAIAFKIRVLSEYRSALKRQILCLVLQIEKRNTTYRKYEESTHSLVDPKISQPSVDISTIWTPIIAAKVRKVQVRQV